MISVRSHKNRHSLTRLSLIRALRLRPFDHVIHHDTIVHLGRLRLCLFRKVDLHLRHHCVLQESIPRVRVHVFNKTTSFQRAACRAIVRAQIPLIFAKLLVRRYHISVILRKRILAVEFIVQFRSQRLRKCNVLHHLLGTDRSRHNQRKRKHYRKRSLPDSHHAKSSCSFIANLTGSSRINMYYQSNFSIPSFTSSFVLLQISGLQCPLSAPLPRYAEQLKQTLSYAQSAHSTGRGKERASS